MAYVKKTFSNEEYRDLNDAVKKYQRKVSNKISCDFCGEPHPIFVYAATRMSTGEVKECWRWCACWKCYLLVETNDWDAIRKQLVEWMRKVTPHVPRHLAEQAAHKSFQEFIDYAKQVDN